MMLNFKHLHYFWVVGQQGGVTKAAESLHVTPQTISGQINQLEAELGRDLFEKAGRGLQMTEFGKLVMRYADDIFTLGNELEAQIVHADEEQPILLRVGVADAVPKTIASRILMPAMYSNARIRFVCKESTQENLLADLALHRLDCVLADGPIPSNLGVRGHNHRLGDSGLSFMAATSLKLDESRPFPQQLHDAPMLLTSDVSQIRAPLMTWFTEQQIVPRILGEFDDRALMKAFGQEGVGVFIVPTSIADEVAVQYNAREIGQVTEVTESFYLITRERTPTNPAVVTIMDEARRWLT